MYVGSVGLYFALERTASGAVFSLVWWDSGFEPETPELEFLNKMPNPAILEFLDLR
jgi:hypothetical protein